MISRRRFIRDMSGVVAGAGLVALPVWQWTAQRQRVERFTRPMMGTDVEIVLLGLERDAAVSAAEQAFVTMKAVADQLTTFDPQSALNGLNASAGKGPVRVGRDLEAVLLQANTMRTRTEGAFTPAILPLSLLWRPPRTQVPEAVAIEEALEAVARAEVRVPSTRLDFGGIAKGYAVDRAVQSLRAAGVTDGIVDAGGDLRLLGSRGGQPWRIGIPNPDHPQQIARVLHLRDAAVATSGGYERFFMVDGVRYHHIVDPRTGYPARSSSSFTVVLGDGTSADAAATAGFVLGPGAGLDFVTSIGGEALALGPGGSWQYTKGLEGPRA